MHHSAETWGVQAAKEVGPYKSQLQDNINNSMHPHTHKKKGPDPEIHSQNKKDPLLCQNESEVHETLQRTIYVSYG